MGETSTIGAEGVEVVGVAGAVAGDGFGALWAARFKCRISPPFAALQNQVKLGYVQDDKTEDKKEKRYDGALTF